MTKARRFTARHPGRSGRARPRMCVEVDVLEAFGAQVRVELRRRDVRVAQHLLQRAQIAAARQQVRREAVAERVRTHPGRQSGRGRVALDDLVEALACEAGAALVDEQPRLPALADESRAAALEVRGERPRGGGADRYEPLLRSLAARAEDAGLE